MTRTKAEARKDSDTHKRDGKASKPTGVKREPTKAAPRGASFVVSSLQEWRSDGWHSDQGPGEYKTDSTHKTLKAANKRAHDLFYKENPWGLEPEEIEDMDVDYNEDGLGCLTLTVYPPDSETWKVKVEMLAGKKK